MSLVAQDPACTEGDLRLANGLDYNDGRIEVCVGGTWGTICDFFWTTYDAGVACKQLDFPGGLLRNLVSNHHFSYVSNTGLFSYSSFFIQLLRLRLGLSTAQDLEMLSGIVSIVLAVRTG